MKHPEEDIAKVLGALRHAEAPEGLEQRILRRVAEREAQAAWRPGWLGIPGRGRSLAYGLAMAAVVAGGVALVAVRRPLRVALDSAAVGDSLGSNGIRSTHRGEALRWMGHPSGLAALDTKTASVLGDGQQKTIRPKVVAKRSAKPEEAEEALARSEMLAASYPAPPMPLTEQERLLLRIAHTGDPQELAALNPETRARVLAQGDAEFVAFFPLPAPANQP